MHDLTNFLKIPLAHRGLHDNNYDENSLGAFKRLSADKQYRHRIV